MTRPPVLPPSYHLVCCDAIGSTNDEAKRLARAGAPERTVVWALEQTAGRGRRGRRWASPRGNLYASLVLRPDCSPESAARLGFAAALAIGDALASLVPGLAGLACKWPNDVLLGGRKIAGILLESEIGPASTVGNGETVAFVVVGIGINLAAAPADAEFPATSLAAEGYPPPEPAAALEPLLRCFDVWERRWREEGFASVRAAWLARAAARGQPIEVRLENRTLRGRFADLDHRGALVLETPDGPRLIAAGDVFPAG
ncbi:MAG TPA: biotin--[acetyl-CoA-carboxylase] ligase [Stellaceae bacterium]|jgi:BirA family biotin operon repressor/biotin-[acetyl-CoA-carboxylase] ligase